MSLPPGSSTPPLDTEDNGITSPYLQCQALHCLILKTMALRFFQTLMTIFRLTRLNIPQDFTISFSPNRPDRLWGHPAGGSFLRGRAAVNLTTHFQLVPMLRMGGATLPLPSYTTKLCIFAFVHTRTVGSMPTAIPFTWILHSVQSVLRPDLTAHPTDVTFLLIRRENMMRKPYDKDSFPIMWCDSLALITRICISFQLPLTTRTPKYKSYNQFLSKVDCFLCVAGPSNACWKPKWKAIML
jgi:hypothetical protein